jgi:hypothetical protein
MHRIGAYSKTSPFNLVKGLRKTIKNLRMSIAVAKNQKDYLADTNQASLVL